MKAPPMPVPTYDLMKSHKVGMRVDRAVEVLNIDQNYFSEE